MSGTIRRISKVATPSATDYASVRVELTDARGSRTSLGSAAEALRDRRLTQSERFAIRALVRAVTLLRTRARLSGIDDAGSGVKLILRDKDATSGGPWAMAGGIAVGSRNGMASGSAGRARADVLLTVDAAVHELAHVVQFARMPNADKPHAAILEGIADAAAILATGDDTLGEEYFHRDASGRYRGSIRELGAKTTSGPSLGSVVKNYGDAISPNVGAHAAGGVVSATFTSLRASLGRERAEQLLWAAIRDGKAWRAGGSWKDLVLAIRRAAVAVFRDDPAVADAVEASLVLTGLDAADR